LFVSLLLQALDLVKQGTKVAHILGNDDKRRSRHFGARGASADGEDNL
jgi:hypothetical protein